VVGTDIACDARAVVGAGVKGAGAGVALEASDLSDNAGAPAVELLLVRDKIEAKAEAEPFELACFVGPSVFFELFKEDTFGSTFIDGGLAKDSFCGGKGTVRVLFSECRSGGRS
jgi:hypothetical protein